MSHEQSRRDLHRESQHPSPAQPSPANLTTSLGHPIHPTTSTSTRTQPTLDGPTNIRDIYEERYAEREERPTTDQSLRPVSHLVARDRSEIRALCDAATPAPWSFYLGDLWAGATGDELATADRLSAEHVFSDEAEDIFERASHLFHGDPVRPEDAQFIAAARDLVPQLVVELERTEGDLGVAVREANHHRALVAKAAELHQADPVDPYWCAACQTSAWPCPTAAALATAAPS